MESERATAAEERGPGHGTQYNFSYLFGWVQKP